MSGGSDKIRFYSSFGYQKNPGVMENTDTHAVLTGHSGMATNKMFTDLEQLKEGDVFYLHTLGETLAYQVTELKDRKSTRLNSSHLA